MKKKIFSVNTNIDEIQAYATKFSRPQRPSTSRNSSPSSLLPLNLYQEMDSKSRSAWKQMNPEIRSKIVKMMSSPQPSPAPQFPRPSYSPTNRVNLHEISLHDVMMSLRDTENTFEKVDIEIDTQELPSSESPNNQLLIQAAKGSKPQ